MSSYATYAEYTALTGDTDSDEARVELYLDLQSAKLRGMCELSGDEELTDDQSTLCATRPRKRSSPQPRAGLTPSTVSTARR